MKCNLTERNDLSQKIDKFVGTSVHAARLERRLLRKELAAATGEGLLNSKYISTK